MKPRIRGGKGRGGKGLRHGGGNHINTPREIAYANRVMNSGGWDLMTLADCVICGEITSGGGHTVAHCNKCVDHILTM